MRKTSKEIYVKFENNPKTVAWVTQQEKEIKNILINWLLLIILSIMVPVFFLLFLTPSESSAQLFQRGGTIILVLSLLAQIKIQNLDNLIISKSHPFLGCNKYIKNEFECYLTLSIYTTYLAIVLGTVISGYGDMLYLLCLAKC